MPIDTRFSLNAILIDTSLSSVVHGTGKPFYHEKFCKKKTMTNSEQEQLRTQML